MRIVDLTMPLDGRSLPIYPGHPEFELIKLTSFAVEGKEVSKLVMGTHMGTHIDAPRHYIEGGATIDAIRRDVVCGPARLIDLAFGGPSYGPYGVDATALAHLTNGHSVERLLIRFDGDKRLGSMDYYFNQPFLTEDAAHWLVDNGCKVLGLDTPMPENPANIKTMPIHKILLGAGVVILEYLVNLAAIKADTFKLQVGFLPIKDGDGAPAACWVEVDD